MISLEKDRETEQQGFQFAFALRFVGLCPGSPSCRRIIHQTVHARVPSSIGLSMEVMLSLGPVSCEDSMRSTKNSNH